jgi:3-oxoacyl-[acyl-carrier protein] reductase
MKTATGLDELPDDLRANLVSSIPRGRLAEPRDVAGAVTFLASEDADFITGTAINVDGGRSV